MDRLSGAPAWRREPYRILFPLGALLAWAGVLHWLLHAAGVLADYEPVFHAITQIQGFMMCFAVGFLFTAIPRRTGTAPPSWWQMAVAMAAPVATVTCAWLEWLAAAQACWTALVLTVIGFAVPRFLSADAARRPPNSFIWVPISLLMGLAGSAMIATASVLDEEYFWLHDIGRNALLQGMFTGLVVGVGGMVLPLLTRGEAPPDARASARDTLARLGHVAAALALGLSFWIEARVSQPGGYALRAAVTLAVLLVSARLYRRPALPGWHRWLVWLSGWMIPVGYTLAALFPLQHKAGLHVVFVGGFALMGLAVGLHVTLAHGGHALLLSGRPWQVPVFGGLLVLAMIFRMLCDFDRVRFFTWLGCAAAAFLLATIAWAWLVLSASLYRWRES